MKRQVRFGVFETNSSSTHAVAILTDQEYDDYKAGKLRISRYGDLTPAEEIDNSDEDSSYEYDRDNMEIEHTEREIGGQHVHALSVYGYDC